MTTAAASIAVRTCDHVNGQPTCLSNFDVGQRRDMCAQVSCGLPQVLGDMPQKTFEFTRRAEATHPLDLPSTATPEDALDRVLRLPAVASKRFLTTKVDRCVTGTASVCRVQPFIIFLPFEEQQDIFAFLQCEFWELCQNLW